MAAYTSGRDTVTLDDCLLLQHILWQRPEEASRISDWLLSQMAEDNGLEAANYILRGESGVCLLGWLHDLKGVFEQDHARSGGCLCISGVMLGTALLLVGHCLLINLVILAYANGRGVCGALTVSPLGGAVPLCCLKHAAACSVATALLHASCLCA